MTCNDCLHWEACRGLLEAMNPDYIGKNFIIRSTCKRFKNKSDYAEVKYGYWEIVKGSNGKEKMVCTNCRHQQDLHSTFTYCPNCGTLIDGRVIYNG